MVLGLPHQAIQPVVLFRSEWTTFTTNEQQRMVYQIHQLYGLPGDNIYSSPGQHSSRSPSLRSTSTLSTAGSKVRCKNGATASLAPKLCLSLWSV